MAFNTHQVKTLVLSFSLCSSSWFSLFSFGCRKYILYCWFKAVGQVSFCHMHRSNWYSYLLNQVLHRFFLKKKKKKKKKEGSAQVGRFYTFIHKYVQVRGIDTKKLYLGVFEIEVSIYHKFCPSFNYWALPVVKRIHFLSWA